MKVREMTLGNSKYIVKVYDKLGGRFCTYETNSKNTANKFIFSMEQFFDYIELEERKNVN